MSDVLPPHSDSAEAAVLGCALISPDDCLPKIIAALKGKSAFYDLRHQTIYSVLAVMLRERAAIDTITVQERLNDAGSLEQIGGIAYLAQIQDVPSAANLPEWLGIVREKWEQRRILEACTDTSAKIAAGNVPNCDLKASVQSAFADVFGTMGDLSERLAARIYSPESKPKEPTPRFSLAEIPICTPGNLTTISAQAKAGKTAAIGAMNASTFSKADADCLGFTSKNPHGYAVIKIDTEQSESDHWDGIQRIIQRAQVDAAPPWLLSYCLTGFSAADVRAAVPCLLEQAKKQFKGIHSVFVDGTADAANDVNDPAESNGLVRELHALAIQFDCPIINVMHVNPSSDFKTRGHLGSQLERKSETNLRLEKDESGATVIWADKNRRAPITKATAPRFMWSDDAGMHVTIGSQRSAKDDAEKQAMQIEAEAVFTAANKEVISYCQFINLLQSEVHASKSTAKRRLAQMISTRILRKELTGFYALNS